MGLISAIIGDICGSKWEYEDTSKIALNKIELFDDNNFFTDDTVLSIATKYALIKGISFEKAFYILSNKYPYSDYGDGFSHWMKNNQVPYNSYGNGSAMRVSYIVEHATSIEEVKLLAKETV